VRAVRNQTKSPELHAVLARSQSTFSILLTSVGDPDPHVFGPPGSGSISQRFGSGSGSGSFPFLINVLSGLK
jgi:hypothetical protein